MTVVDSIGAGYLSATLDGLDVESCLELAFACVGFCVGALGDWEAPPT